MSERKHGHYFKPCPYDSVDVYRVLGLFNVTDPCLQHAIKKLLVAGGRGAKAQAGWTIDKDVGEAIDTLVRWQEMRAEEASVPVPFFDPNVRPETGATAAEARRQNDEAFTRVFERRCDEVRRFQNQTMPEFLLREAIRSMGAGEAGEIQGGDSKP